jgi:L-fuconolactonase
VAVIDAHHHFWDPDRGDYPWMVGKMAPIRRRFGPADLAPVLDDCGVSATVLVQTWSSLDETREFLETAVQSDFVAGVVGWVDLTDPFVPRTIHELQSSPNGRYLVGLRHQVHDEPDPGWLTRPDVGRALSAIAEAGLVYDLLVRPRELPAALAVARAHPDLTFVVDHIAKPDIANHEIAEWASRLAPLARLPNVRCKLSGMVTEASWSAWRPRDLLPYVERVIGWFGPDRVMFGSDWPVCLVAGTYRQVFEALGECIGGMTDAEKDGVLGANAARIYRLPGMANA